MVKCGKWCGICANVWRSRHKKKFPKIKTFDKALIDNEDDLAAIFEQQRCEMIHLRKGGRSRITVSAIKATKVEKYQEKMLEPERDFVELSKFISDFGDPKT